MLPETSTPLIDFVVGRPLGGSGGGTVYRAWHPGTRRQAAVKAINLPADAPRVAVVRFVSEMALLARLHHPGIVQVHGVGQADDGRLWLVMELVPGINLAAKIAYRPLKVQEAVEIVATVAEALDYAHQRGVIHRDLKPGNILLTTDGRVKVTDFCPLVGTPPYMAPEQASRRFGPIGLWTDVYGLGALLYTLLTRRQPFPGTDPLEVAGRVVSDELPPPLSCLRPDVPEALDRVCMQCLSKDPTRRFATAGEMATALRAATGTEVESRFVPALETIGFA